MDNTGYRPRSPARVKTRGTDVCQGPGDRRWLAASTLGAGCMTPCGRNRTHRRSWSTHTSSRTIPGAARPDTGLARAAGVSGDAVPVSVLFSTRPTTVAMFRVCCAVPRDVVGVAAATDNRSRVLANVRRTAAGPSPRHGALAPGPPARGRRPLSTTPGRRLASPMGGPVIRVVELGTLGFPPPCPWAGCRVRDRAAPRALALSRDAARIRRQDRWSPMTNRDESRSPYYASLVPFRRPAWRTAPTSASGIRRAEVSGRSRDAREPHRKRAPRRATVG